MTRLRPYTVLITGGRGYADRDALYFLLDVLPCPDVMVLIHGNAKGADRLAQEWAEDRQVRARPYPAVWGNLSHPDALIRYTRDGRAYDARAGLRRNQKMLNEGRPDLVIAFPGGPGTAHMISIAKAAGTPVFIYKQEAGEANKDHLSARFDPWAELGSKLVI